MALIKCPECGESVSSSADKCVHCGAEFSVCPECEQIFMGKPEICSNCGYSFAPQKANSNKVTTHPNPAVQSQLKLYNVMGAWRADSPFHAKFYKYRKIAVFSTLIIAIVLMVIAALLTLFMKFDQSSYTDILNDILNGKNPVSSLMSSIKAALAFALIFLLINSNLYSLSDIYLFLSVGALIKKYVPDKGRIIEFYKNKTVQNITVESVDYERSDFTDLGSVYSCVYITDVKQGKLNFIIHAIVSFFLSLIATVFLGIALEQTAEQYIIMKLSDKPFEFQYIAIYIIVFVVFFIADIVFNSIFSSSFANKSTAYCNGLCPNKTN